MKRHQGLRSTRSGEQCESIVCFPSLFAKYPFPIVVNAGFLKLADVFRGGTTFMKLCVLKVIQDCDSHLDKILNIDEFLRRILSVTHSNDPVARAIALRVLGSIASIIAEKKSVHHCIRSGLDSHNEVEVEAAIFATKAFTQQSSEFAEGISHKIGGMIDRLAVPTKMKLKLIPILEHMHHNITTANMVHDFCLNWMESYNSQNFVITILDTLTALTASTLVNIPEQVDHLLVYLEHDGRAKVKLVVLKNLLKLSKCAAHLWKQDQMKKLTLYASQTISENLRTGCLAILKTLSTSVQLSGKFNDEILDKLESIFTTGSIQCISLSLEMKVNLIIHKRKLLVQQFATCKHDLEFTIKLAAANENLPVLKRCLKCIQLLCNLSCDDSRRFSTYLINLLTIFKGEFLLQICHCLVAINRSVDSILINQLSMISNVLDLSCRGPHDELHNNIIVGLATLYFQATFSLDIKTPLNLDQLKARDDWWLIYRIARQAAQLGCSSDSQKLFKDLSNKVCSEKYYMWLMSLTKLMEAESLFATDCSTTFKLSSKLRHAQELYRTAFVDMKAGATPEFSLSFQQQFIKLRADSLRAYQQLMTCCTALKTCPPPIRTVTESLSNARKATPLHNEFQDCASCFRKLRDSYSELFQTCFDADKGTLDNILALQGQCSLAAYAIDKLVATDMAITSFNKNEEQDELLNSNKNWFLNHTSKINQLLVDEIEQLAEDTIGHQLSHLRVICTQFAMPLPYPLFFFKKLQATSIKLAVSVPGQEQSESISVCTNTELVIKAEGLIEHDKSHVVFRSVKKVSVVVCTLLGFQANSKVVTANINDELEQALDLHHGYFCSQFLVSLKHAGTHSVHVKASVFDENNILWKTNATARLTVNSYDAPTRKS